MWTLDEAIKLLDEKSKELLEVKNEQYFESAQEHLQLVMWLRELKRYREMETAFLSVPSVNIETSTIPPACRYCSNHPSNGGSGICHCTLGSSITY